MKYTNILKLSAIALFSICASCGDKHDDHAGHDHAEGDHDKAKKDTHAGHDHDDPDADHSNCSVVVGPKGGRMIEEMAELNLNDAGQLTLDFSKAPSADTKVALLINSESVELTKEGNTYTSASIADKLPAEVHVSIKSADDIHVEKIQVEAGKCTKCTHAKLACTCDNHAHDHGDDKDHDKKDDPKLHAHGHDHGHTQDGHKHDDHKGHDH